jgi:hypothetical protein
VSADDAPDPDRLGDEQCALRRVATLVARGVPPAGAFAAVSRQRLRPAGAEERLADFSEPVGTAIANAESRAEPLASRARTLSPLTRRATGSSAISMTVPSNASSRWR